MRAWEQFLSEQEKELGSETVNKWLRSLQVVRFDAGNLYLEAKDAFQILWFEEHLRKKVQDCFLNNNHRHIKVHIALRASEDPPKKKKNVSVPKPTPAIAPSEIVFNGLDPHCTFDTFIKPPGHLPFTVLTNCSQSKELFFNPIYVCGPAGTGKSHLLMATAHTLQAMGKRVIYAHAETFTDHVVKAIRASDMTLFRQSYRNADTLIMDDVHLLAKKWATQEEFFHTFNTLHLAQRQIILSASCPPGELQFIEPRLVSRFEWGIVLTLDAMQKEELKHVLEMKCMVLKCPLNNRVMAFLLETFGSNAKVLCRALEALVLRIHLHPTAKRGSTTQLTVAFVEQQLADLIREEKQAAVTSTKVVQRVAEHYGLRAEDLLGKAQTRECVQPRQIAMYLCRTLLRMPFPKIGQLFSKNHSTVISSVRVIQKEIDEANPEFINQLNAVQKKLR